MPGPSYDDDFTPGFWEKNRALFIVVGVVLLIGGFFFFKMRGAKSSPPPKVERLTMITLPPPPTPPPPRPTPPPPVNTPPPEKMEQQAPVEKPEEKPAPPKPKNDEPPDQPLGTNLKGPGGDSFGLGSGNGSGGLGGSGRGGGSKWGWYAGQVQTKIADALRKNSRTKDASLRVEVRVWPDSTGRIIRASLVGSTGDRAVDEAIQNEVLNGLQLQEAPPPEMPLPIVLRLTARRPN